MTERGESFPTGVVRTRERAVTDEHLEEEHPKRTLCNTPAAAANPLVATSSALDDAATHPSAQRRPISPSPLVRPSELLIDEPDWLPDASTPTVGTPERSASFAQPSDASMGHRQSGPEDGFRPSQAELQLPLSPHTPGALSPGLSPSSQRRRRKQRYTSPRTPVAADSSGPSRS